MQEKNKGFYDDSSFFFFRSCALFMPNKPPGFLAEMELKR
jgi:hypothetical protein